jgi:hypothetical protein
MIKWFIRTFGLKGSWLWAVKQMKNGHMVRPASATGIVKYRFSRDGQNRLEWNFSVTPHFTDWENAFLFEQDLFYTDWYIYW